MTILAFEENSKYFVAMYFYFGNLLLVLYKKLDENHGERIYEKYITELNDYNEVPEWNSLVNYLKKGICDKLFFEITKDIKL